MKIQALLLLLAAPFVTSCVTQNPGTSSDRMSFFGAGFGKVENKTGVALQGGYYVGEEGELKERLGAYGTFGYSFRGPWSNHEDAPSTLWGSGGATYRASKSLGLRAGLTLARINTYVIEYGSSFGEPRVGENAELRLGPEIGLDYILEEHEMLLGITYSSAHDGTLFSVSWTF